MRSFVQVGKAIRRELPRVKRHALPGFAVLVCFLFLIPSTLWLPGAVAETNHITKATTYIAGEISDYQFQFNTGQDTLAGDGAMKITFGNAGGQPWGLTGISVVLKGQPLIGGGEQTERPQGANVVSNPAENSVTIRRVGGSAQPWTGTITVAIENVVNPLWSGTTGTFDLMVKMLGDADLQAGTGDFPPILLTKATLSSFSVSTVSQIVNETSDHSFAFTTNKSRPPGHAVLVTFPDDYDIATVPTTPGNPIGFCGAPTVTREGRSVKLNQTSSCSAGSDVRFSLQGLKTAKRSFPSGIFRAALLAPDGAVYADTSAPGLVFQPKNDYFVSTSSVPSDLGAGALGNHSITFTSDVVWPGRGYLALYMPPLALGQASFQDKVDDTTGAEVVSGGANCGGSFEPPARMENGARRVVLLQRTSAANCAPGPITINISAIQNPGVPGSYASPDLGYTFAIQGPDGVDLQASDFPDPITITAGTTVARADFPSNTKVAQPNVVLTLSLQHATDWPANGRATIDFPQGFTLATGLTATTTCSGSLLASVNGLRVTLTRGGGAAPCPAGTHTITLNTVTTPPAAGHPNPVAVTLLRGDGLVLEKDEVVVYDRPLVPFLALSLAEPTSGPLITANDLAANSSGTYTFRIKSLGSTGQPWRGTDRFAIGFPAGYDLSGIGNAVAATGPCFPPSNSASLAVLSVIENVVLLQRPAGATDCTSAADHSFTVANVRNPLTTGETGSFYFATRSQAGVDQRAYGKGYPTTPAVALPSVIIQVVHLQGAKVLPTTLTAGSSTLVTVQFANSFEIPTNANFTVRFPTGFVVDSPAAIGGLEGCGGLTAVKISDSIVNVTRTGTGSCPVGQRSFTFSGVTNPKTAGTTGTFDLRIVTKDHSLIAQNVSIDGIKILPALGALSNPTVTSSTGLGYANATPVTYTIGFESAGGVPPGGKVVIDLPNTLDVTGLTAPAQTRPAGCAEFGYIRTVHLIELQNTDASPCPSGDYAFAFGGAKNPAFEQDIAFTSVIRSASGVDLEEAAPVVLHIDPSPLQASAVIAEDRTVGAETIYRVKFTSLNPWPRDGQILIEFPDGYDVSDATQLPMSGCSGAFASVIPSQDGKSIRLMRDGTGTLCSGNPTEVTVKLADVRNAPSAITPRFNVFLLDAEGRVQSAAVQVAGLALLPVDGELQQVTVEVLHPQAGALTTLWTNFTTGTTWPSDGRLAIRFPAGFNIGSAQLAAFTGCGGTFQRLLDTSTRTITITRGAGAPACADAHIVLRFDAIRNPPISGTTGPFAIMFRNAVGSDLQAHNLATVGIAPGALGISNLAPTSSLAGVTTDYRFTLSPSNPWPADGNLVIDLPAGVSGTVVDAATLTLGNDQRSLSVLRQDLGAHDRLVLTRPGSGPTLFASGNVLVKNVKNPTSTGPTPNFVISTANAAGVVIDSNAAQDVTIQPKGFVLDTPIITATPSTAGQVAAYSLAFLPRTDLPPTSCFRIVFPSSFGVNTATLTAAVTVGGTNVPVSILPMGPGITLGQSDAPTPFAAQPVTITLDGIVNPAVANDEAGPIQVVTLESSDGSTNDCLGADLDGAYDGIVAIAPASASVQVNTFETLAGALADYTFEITGAPGWQASDTLRIVFPHEIILDSVLPTATSPDSAAGALEVSILDEENALAVARAANAPSWNAGTKTIRIFDLRNPLRSTDASHASMKLLDHDGNVRASADAIALPDVEPVGGALSALTVDLDDDLINAETLLTVGFTTISALPEDAGFRVRLPDGFDVANVGTEVQGTPASLGSVTAAAVGGQDILLTRDGPVLEGPANVVLTLNGLVNPSVAGLPGTIEIASLTADGADLDLGLVSAPLIRASDFAATISASNRLAGTVDTYTFTWNADQSWPGNGRMTIDFPAGYSLASAYVHSFTGCHDNLQTVQKTTSLWELRRQGTSPCDNPETSKVLVLRDVRNPLKSGQPEPFTITLQDAQGQPMAVTQPIPAPRIEAFSALLSDASAEPTDESAAVAGKTNAVYDVQFRTTGGIPENGYISLRWPAGVNVNAATMPSNALGGCTTLSVAAGDAGEMRRRLDSECAGGALHAFQISGLANPPHGGLIGEIVIAVQDSTGRDLESAAVPLELGPAVLTLHPPQRVAGSNVAGEIATFAVSFTPTNPLPADGKILVEFPPAMDLATATVSSWQGCPQATVGEVTQTANLLLVSLAGDAADPDCAAGVKTLQVANIRNSGLAGDTTVWRAHTKLHDGRPIDGSGDVSGPMIAARGGGLITTAIELDDELVGAAGAALLAFKTSTSWPSDGRFAVFVPPGFSWSNPGATNTGPNACSGSFTAQATGRLLTLTRAGATGACASQVVHAIRVTGLVNGPNAGVSAPFHVGTQTAEGYDIDSSDVATVTLSPKMMPATLTANDATASAKTDYSLVFDSMVPWPKDGLLFVSLPAGTGLGTFSLPTTVPCADAGLQKTTLVGVPASVITLRLTDASCPRAVFSITLKDIVNTASSGDLPVRLSLTSKPVDGRFDILSGTQDTVLEIAATPMTSPTLTVTPSLASHTAQYRFTFGGPALPVGGKVRFTFVSAYGLDGVIGVANGAGSTPAFAVAKDVGTVTATLQGTTAWAAGSRTLVVSGIRNPHDQGAAPNIGVEFLDALGAPLAAASFTGPTLGAPHDLIAPGLPGNLLPTTSLKSQGWSAGRNHTVQWAPASDNLVVAGYSYAIDQVADAVIDTVTASAYVSFPSGGEFDFHLRAIDGAGNLGEERIFHVNLDVHKPVLGTLTATAGVQSCTTGTSVTVSWPAASDLGSGLHTTTPYKVAVGTADPTVVTGTSTAVSLSKGKNNVTVTAFDQAGNTAVRFIELRRDVDAPTATLQVPAFAKGAFEIRWNGTDDCAGIKEYRVESRLGTSSVFTALYEGTLNKTIVPAPAQDGTLYFRVRATDNADRSGAITSAPVVSTVFDSAAPTPPAKAEAVSLASGHIKLTWLPAADLGTAVSGYHVYRSDAADTGFTQITSTALTATSYVDSSTKEAGREYFYKVAAVDGAGNIGEQSLTSSAKADTRQVATISSDARAQVAEALGLFGFVSTLKAVDNDNDGRFDDIDEPSGVIDFRSAVIVEGRQAVLLDAVQNDAFALWFPSTDEIRPVSSARAETVGEERHGNETAVAVRVHKASGWILIDAPDKYPARDLVRIVANDGRQIALEQAFRENGRVFVLDDPDVTYFLVYDGSGGALSTETGGVRHIILWVALAVGALVIALAATALLVRRARHNNAPSFEAAPESLPQPDEVEEMHAESGPGWTPDQTGEQAEGSLVPAQATLDLAAELLVAEDEPILDVAADEPIIAAEPDAPAPPSDAAPAYALDALASLPWPQQAPADVRLEKALATLSTVQALAIRLTKRMEALAPPAKRTKPAAPKKEGRKRKTAHAKLRVVGRRIKKPNRKK